MSEPIISTEERDLVAVLRRSGTADRPFAGMKVPGDTVLPILREQPQVLEEVAARLSQNAARLPRLDEAGTQSFTDYPAQDPWLRNTSAALQGVPQLAEACGTRPEALDLLLDQDVGLRAVMHFAGRILDGTMDMRLLFGAFGWFILDKVLAALRQQVEDPTLPREQREAVLRDFAPMLVILDEVQRTNEARREELKGERHMLRTEIAQVDAAKERLDSERVEGKLRAGKEVSEEDLLRLTQKDQGEVLASPRPPAGRRTRR